MDKNGQSEFLLAEYHNINSRISVNNQNITVILKLFFGFIAGCVAAIMLGLSKDVGVQSLLLISALLCSFAMVFSWFLCIVLAQEQTGYRKRLQALNSIRKYFLDINPENKQYFVLPASTEEYRPSRISSSPGVAFMILFYVILVLSAACLWCLYLEHSRFQTVLVVGLVAILGLILLKATAEVSASIGRRT